jgi:regulator of protease activity HflC (stomatin/prohibitin superfamily)
MPIIHKIPQNHVVIVERFGKFSSIQREGLRFLIPFLDQPKEMENWSDRSVKRNYQNSPIFIELSEQRGDTPARQAQTSDNATVSANASVYWRITDPVKAVYEIENLPASIMDVTLNALRANIGKLTLNQILSERQSVNQRIATELLDTTNRWGVTVSRVEIQEISYNKETEGAMLQQVSADRKKVALISEAEGEAQAIKIKALAQSEAIKLIADSEKYYLEQIAGLSDSETAIRALIAMKYLQGMDTITKNAGDKVFIPNNFMALYDSTKFNRE